MMLHATVCMYCLSIGMHITLHGNHITWCMVHFATATLCISGTKINSGKAWLSCKLRTRLARQPNHGNAAAMEVGVATDVGLALLAVCDAPARAARRAPRE
jgi:hypothetical protein